MKSIFLGILAMVVISGMTWAVMEKEEMSAGASQVEGKNSVRLD